MTDEEINELYQEVGARIRAARKERKLSQEQLGAAAELHRVSILNIEKGTQRLPLYMLYRIANALKLSPHELLPVKAQPVPEDMPKEIRRSTEGVQVFYHDLVGTLPKHAEAEHEDRATRKKAATRRRR